MAERKTARTASPWGTKSRKRESQFNEKRETVFDTAARLFRERGFDDTSLNDIAEILNITKPTVYYYVKSKEDLIYQIKCMAQERLLADLRLAADAEGDGLSRLRAAMIAYGVFMTTDYGVCLAIVPARHMEEVNRRSFYKGVTEANEVLAALISAGIADKSIRPVDAGLVIRTLFGALNWVGMWYRPGSKLGPAELASAQVDLLLDGIAA